MRRLTLPLALLASLLVAGSAHAAASDLASRLAKMTRTSIAAPTEWDGVWDTLDSLYDCQGNPMFVFPGKDTICGGKEYSPGGVTLTCTGTANATTLDLTCTGDDTSDPSCTAHYSTTIHGTLSGSSYLIVSTSNITYSGADCSLYQDTCVQVNAHGTRASSAPAAFCDAVPTLKPTWGQVKTIYR